MLPNESNINPMKILMVTGLAVFLVFLDATILYVTFDNLTQYFSDHGLSNISWVLNSYTIALSTLLLPLGLYSNYFGLKKMYLIGAFTFGAASILCSLSPTLNWLIFGRLLQGIGAAIIIPSSLTLVLSVFPNNKRPIAISLWGALAALSAAIGPSLGSILVDLGGWRWVFWVNVPIVIITIIGTKRIVQEVVFREYGLPNIISIALAILGTFLITYSLTTIDKTLDTKLLTAFFLGIAILAFFILHNQLTSSPLIQKTLLTNRIINLANTGTLIFSIAFSIMFFGKILFLINIWDYKLFLAGLAVTPGPLTVIPVAIISGKILRQKGHSKLALFGSISYLIGSLYAYFLWDEATNYLLYCLPSLILTGIGVGVLLPTLSTLAMSNVEPKNLAQAVSLNQAIRQLGSVLGVALMIFYFNTFVGVESLAPYKAIFSTMCVCVLITIVTLLMMSTYKHSATINDSERA